MCGQFAVLASLKAIKDYYEFLKDRSFMFDIDEFYEFDSDLLINLPQETVKPMNYLPIVAFSQSEIGTTDNIVSIMPARWGLVPHWAKDESFALKTINARIETLSEKASFKDAYQKRRCLVPMTGFYEKGRYFPNADDGLKSFAGLYEVWEMGAGRMERGDGSMELGSRTIGNRLYGATSPLPSPSGEGVLTTFTIVTCPADDRVLGVHHRMPVVLDEVQAVEWLCS